MYHNLRQLQLLYYIYLHGGITPASKNMPQRLAAATVSTQIQELERTTGPLFHRKPFRELPEGRRLFELIRPFFENLEREHQRHQRPGPGMLRVGVAPRVSEPYLVAMILSRHASIRDVQIVLREANETQLDEALAHGQLDLAIGAGLETPVDGETRALAHGRLALLVHRRSAFRSGERWWLQLHPEDRLIGPGPETTIGRAFERHLQRLKLKVPVAFAVDSLHALVAAVTAGGGVGVTLDLAGMPRPKGLRLVPLPEPELVPISAAWRLPASAPVKAMVEVVLKRAAEMAGERPPLG